jgi:Rrf2 family protein
MIFSTRIEYGVMMLTDLARHYGKGPLSLSEIGAHLDLSVAYLEQIVPNLRKVQLIESIRGAKGGYILSMPPNKIRMGAVVRALEEREGSFRVMRCATLSGDAEVCNHEEICTAPILWMRVRDAISQALDSTTLADLVPETRRSLPISLEIKALTGDKENKVILAVTTEN